MTDPNRIFEDRQNPIPKPYKSVIADLTGQSYGRVVPVAYGSGFVDLFLAYGAWTPRIGVGATFEEDADTGELTYVGGDVWGAPLAYIACHGPITAWQSIVRDNIRFEQGAAGAGTCPPPHTGDITGTPRGGAYAAPEMTMGDPATVTDWAIMSSQDPEDQVQFGLYAVLRGTFIVCPNKRFPRLKALIEGRFADYEVPSQLTPIVALHGAAPSDVIRDIVEEPIAGMGLPTGTITTSTGSDGSADSSYEAYMAARGWLICRVFDSEGTAIDALDELLAATDSTLFDGAESITIIPRCADAITHPVTGAVYTPPVHALLMDDDTIILESEDAEPIEMTRVPESEISTVVPVEYAPVYSADGSLATVESMEAAHSQWGTLGVRRGAKLSLPCIPDEKHAQDISQLAAQRSIYNRGRYRLMTGWRFISVTPGDIIHIHHTMGGLDEYAQVISYEESTDGFMWELEEYYPGVAMTVDTLPQTGDGLGESALIPPDSSSWGASIAALGDDGILTPVEKKAALLAYNSLDLQGDEAIAKAGGLAPPEATTPFTTPFGALTTYLATISPAWNDPTTGNSVVVGTTWRTKWEDAYEGLSILQGNLTARAQADALAAKAAVADMGNDGVLTPSEKIYVIREVAAIVAEYSALYNATLSARSENASYRSAYGTKYAALVTTYLGTTIGTNGSPKAWNDLSGNTNVVAANYNAAFNEYYLARTNLVNANADLARADAYTAQQTANNAPNADKVDGYHASITSVASTCAVRDANQNITAYDFTTTSDLRLKERIESVTGVLDRVLELRGVGFQFKADESHQRRLGLLAQDVARVFPEAVTQDDEGFLRVSYGALVSVLVEAIREQQAQIAQLGGKA